MDHVAKHSSLWIDTAAAPTFPVLQGDLDVDVCIIGGGITGLTAARLLKAAGKTVAVVEALSVGGGETGHTTAHLASHHDLYYSDTISKFGEDDARQILESRCAAIRRIERFVEDDRIECHFERVPAYLFTEDARDSLELGKELDACKRLGMDCEGVQDLPVGFPVRNAIRFANQAQFHPLEYLRALAKGVPGDGSHVFEHTRAIDIVDAAPCSVKTEHGTITCREVVVAMNAPLNNHGLLMTKIAAYRSYAVAFQIDAEDAPNALLWDTADPYHYVRMHRNGEATFLIVGGEDHKTGVDENAAPVGHGADGDAAWRRIEGWTRGRFVVGEVVSKWSGQVLEPADGLPYIGKNGAHVHVATGFSGDGMTNGTMAAMLLTQEILGERTATHKIYDATRFEVFASVKEYVRENVDFPMHLIGDRLRRPEGKQLRVVGNGEGKIVRVGSEKLAVFREESGVVHAFSPVCPHMGCHVKWNAAETSWDCPCHGSRFDATSGKVLNGPAVQGLACKDVSDRVSALPQPRDTRPSFPGTA